MTIRTSRASRFDARPEGSPAAAVPLARAAVRRRRLAGVAAAVTLVAACGTAAARSPRTAQRPSGRPAGHHPVQRTQRGARRPAAGAVHRRHRDPRRGAQRRLGRAVRAAAHRGRRQPGGRVPVPGRRRAGRPDQGGAVRHRSRSRRSTGSLRPTAPLTAPGPALSGRVRVVVYNPELVDEAPDTIDEVVPATSPAGGSATPRPTPAGSRSSPACASCAARTAPGRGSRQFAAQEPVAYEGNSQVRDAVDAGEVQIGLINHYYLYELIAEKGADERHRPQPVHGPRRSGWAGQRGRRRDPGLQRPAGAGAGPRGLPDRGEGPGVTSPSRRSSTR